MRVTVGRAACRRAALHGLRDRRIAQIMATIQAELGVVMANVVTCETFHD